MAVTVGTTCRGTVPVPSSVMESWTVSEPVTAPPNDGTATTSEVPSALALPATVNVCGAPDESKLGNRTKVVSPKSPPVSVMDCPTVAEGWAGSCAEPAVAVAVTPVSVGDRSNRARLVPPSVLMVSEPVVAPAGTVTVSWVLKPETSDAGTGPDAPGKSSVVAPSLNPLPKKVTTAPGWYGVLGGRSINVTVGTICSGKLPKPPIVTVPVVALNGTMTVAVVPSALASSGDTVTVPATPESSVVVKVIVV